MDEIAIVLLAGGQGRRIGGGKPQRRLGGAPLIDRALALAAAWSDSVAIAVRSGDQASDAAAPTVIDDAAIAGPLAGLVSALRFAGRRGRTAVLIIPCDMPFLPDNLPDRLGSAGAEVALAASGGRLHPVCSLWRAHLLPAALDYSARGRRSLKGLASELGHATVEWPFAEVDPFLNVNTPDDLERAERLLRGPGPWPRS